MADDGEEQSILYDLLVHHEWVRETVDTTITEPKTSSSSSLAGGWRGLSARARAGATAYQDFLRLRNISLPWQVGVTADASRMAVLQDDMLEVLAVSERQHHSNLSNVSAVCANSNYEIIWSAEMPIDPLPHFRKLVWSDDGSMLVVTASNGLVTVFDEEGNVMYAIVSQNLPAWNAPSSTETSFCSVFFKECKSEDWCAELVLVTYSGKIVSFLLSFSGYQDHLACSVESDYSSGITCVAFTPSLELFFCAGPQGCDNGRFGLTCWRLLSDEPCLAKVERPSMHKSASRSNLWTRLLGTAEADFIYLLEVSPDGTRLGAVHFSGAVSIWSLPALIHVQSIPLEEQASFDDISPELLQGSSQAMRACLLKHPFRWSASSMHWWEHDKLVLARLSGGIVIFPLEDSAVNLLGSSAEFFAPCMSVCSKMESGFFILECSVEPVDDNAQEDDSEADDGYLSSLREMTGRVTNRLWRKAEPEQDFFQQFTCPVGKKVYRLLYFQSTTPLELFLKKIDSQEYGEAIILSRHYGLDSDWVYERQWALSQHNRTAMEDYLAKIKHLPVVLKECLRKIPQSIDDAEYLLTFGIKRAGQCMSEENDLADLAQECRQRMELFLERLHTYRSVLQNRSSKSEGVFSPEFYRRLRGLSVRECAELMAQEGSFEDVATLLHIHWRQLEDFHLEILSSFPESLAPSCYANVLPFRNGKISSKYSTDAIRQWCEDRAVKILNNCSLADNALELLQLAEASGIGVDPKLLHRVATLATLQFENPDELFSLDSMQSLSNYDVVERMQRAHCSSAASMVTNLVRVVLPFLTRVEQLQRGETAAVLGRHLAHVARAASLRKAQALLEAICKEAFFRQAVEEEKLAGMCVDVLYAIESREDLDALRDYLRFLGTVQIGSTKARAFLENAVDLAGHQVNSLKILRAYDLQLPIGNLAENKRNEQYLLEISAQLIDKALHANKPMDVCLKDVCDVQKSFPEVSFPMVFELFCQKLLESSNSSHIRMVSEILDPAKATYSDARRVMSQFDFASFDAGVLVKMVIAACIKYLDSASKCTDRVLSFPRLCLSLFHLDEKNLLVLRTRHMLAAIDLLAGLDDGVIPKTLKSVKTRRDLLRLCGRVMGACRLSATTKDAIVNFAKTLSRANLISEVDIAGKLLAKFESLAELNEDWSLCSTTCKEIMTAQLRSGWHACFSLATCDRFKSNKEKVELFSFCVTFGDASVLKEALRRKSELKAAPVQRTNDLPVGIFYEDCFKDMQSVHKEPSYEIESEHEEDEEEHAEEEESESPEPIGAQEDLIEASEELEPSKDLSEMQALADSISSVRELSEHEKAPYYATLCVLCVDSGRLSTEDAQTVAGRFCHQVVRGVPASLRTLAANIHDK